MWWFERSEKEGSEIESVQSPRQFNVARLVAEATAGGPKGALRKSGVGHPRVRVQHAFGAWMALLFAPIRNGMELVFALVRNEGDVVFAPPNHTPVVHTTPPEGSFGYVAFVA